MDSEFESKPIRALWWKEPFGSLMLHGKIETRTWPTNYRGLVLICCSQYPYDVQTILNISGHEQHRRIITPPFFIHPEPLGKAIAVGELVGCRPMTKADEDACFVGHREELWCHVYKNVRAIEPFPLKGAQGWRKLDEETIARLKFI